PGNTDVQRESALRLGFEREAHVAVPRVVRLLRDYEAAALGLNRSLAAYKEVDVYVAAPYTVHVPGNRWDEPRDVDRAARRAEPRLAFGCAVVAQVLPVRLERVRIEEPVALHRDAREEAVVDHAFEDVDVPGVGVQEEHAVVPHRVRDGGARLGVRRPVRQIVRLTEGFSPAGRPDAARDVELR